MRLNRRQLRNMILREVRSMTLNEGVEAVKKEAQEKHKDKAVGVARAKLSNLAPSRQKACANAKAAGGKSGEKYDMVKGEDGKDYVVCIMNK